MVGGRLPVVIAGDASFDGFDHSAILLVRQVQKFRGPILKGLQWDRILAFHCIDSDYSLPVLSSVESMTAGSWCQSWFGADGCVSRAPFRPEAAMFACMTYPRSAFGGVLS